MGSDRLGIKCRKSGSFGDTGVFSFHGSKVLVTGEGGMLVTNREDVYQRNKNAYKISPYGLNLPSGMNMTKEKVGYVCEALKSKLGVGRVRFLPDHNTIGGGD